MAVDNFRDRAVVFAIFLIAAAPYVVLAEESSTAAQNASLLSDQIMWPAGDLGVARPRAKL